MGAYTSDLGSENERKSGESCPYLQGSIDLLDGVIYEFTLHHRSVEFSVLVARKVLIDFL